MSKSVNNVRCFSDLKSRHLQRLIIKYNSRCEYKLTVKAVSNVYASDKREKCENQQLSEQRKNVNVSTL